MCQNLFHHPIFFFILLFLLCLTLHPVSVQLIPTHLVSSLSMDISLDLTSPLSSIDLSLVPELVSLPQPIFISLSDDSDVVEYIPTEEECRQAAKHRPRRRRRQQSPPSKKKRKKSTIKLKKTQTDSSSDEPSAMALDSSDSVVAARLKLLKSSRQTKHKSKYIQEQPPHSFPIPTPPPPPASHQPILFEKEDYFTENFFFASNSLTDLSLFMDGLKDNTPGIAFGLHFIFLSLLFIFLFLSLAKDFKK